MNFGLKNRLSLQATVVSNEFIDTYMAAANGEYVKVFLYLLRHEGDIEKTDISAIADALNHTEADVKRALLYWEKVGILSREEDLRQPEEGREQERRENSRTGAAREASGNGEAAAALAARGEASATAQAYEEMPAAVPAAEEMPAREIPQPGDSYARMERLSEDVEFSALLYAVQQYLGKTFSQIECEKFAFFYDGLHMSGELLEYLAEYCAGGGHTSIRYIEKVALNWYQMGIETREEARNYTLRYSKDMSAVMKAFGITGRSPATAEQEFMKKWFREYGFDSKLVTEACNRTIKATGAASFPYADKILSGWKENGVKVLGDVEELDKKRQASRRQGKEKEGAKKPSGSNRFKNFDERAYDYEGYVWEGVRKRQRKEDVGNGTQ